MCSLVFCLEWNSAFVFCMSLDPSNPFGSLGQGRNKYLKDENASLWLKMGSKLYVSHLLNADPGSQLGSSQTSSSPCLEQTNSPILTVQMSNASSPNAVDWNEQSLSSEFEERDYGEDPGISSLARPIHGSVSYNTSLLADSATASSEARLIPYGLVGGLLASIRSSQVSIWPEIASSEFCTVSSDCGYLELSRDQIDPSSVGAGFHHEAGSSMWADVHGSSGTLHSMHDQKFYFQQLNTADFLTHKLIDAKLDADNTAQDVVNGGNMLIPYGQIVAQAKIPYAAKVDSQVGRASNDEARELKKLDSFGKWMDKNIGGDCDDSLMASDSCNYWNTLDTENDKEVSSLSRHMQLNIDELGPSVILQEQLFTICDFAPDWAYTGVETKFEYLERSPEAVSSAIVKTAPKDEVLFQVRLTKMLDVGSERKWLDCSVVGCDKFLTRISDYGLYTREETVVALVRLGAAAGAVDDPTSASPGGQTAADLASTEKATETAAQNNVLSPGMAVNEEHSLRGSLAAVRKSSHAAALIQAAFRARSFRHRQHTKSNSEISETSLDLVTLGLLNKVQKVSHFEDYLHSAAIRIQQKYRGWKGRREFLKIRKRIVKIQAHVRGHQVRKQYKKVVWSVSIVEKAILRWRRKRHGLRGFRMEKTNENGVPETEKCDEYEFLRIGRRQKIAGVEKALARVQSMVRHPEARDQYMRLVKKYEDCKLSNEATSASGLVPGNCHQKDELLEIVQFFEKSEARECDHDL
ncbi:ethylene induced calmodulin binding protein [Actinidia rufa]|uniref:Ethylene induced calmodulin binding protein n=1 Tax=Actinidia rufa TaxID=165716 RepID=A0A7J0GST6_9ERIC|nr:ethylene induced calmodulin binding protein [Actinidia rufa]